MGYNYEVVIDGGKFLGSGLLAMIVGLFMAIMVFALIIAVIMIIAQWKIYTKAGKPGWAAIVPIYSQIVLLEICDIPTWQVLFYFIPIANVYIYFVSQIELAKKFGKTAGYGVAMVFFGVILLPVLAFGHSQYQGSGTNTNNGENPFPNQPQQTQGAGTNTPAFCSQCGSQIVSGSTFCANCGKQL